MYKKSIYLVPLILLLGVINIALAIGPALNPDPPDGATDMPLDTKLSWTPSGDAEEQHVYFGTNKTAVANADQDSSEYKDSLGWSKNSYDPGPLKSCTKYYWRIDTCVLVVEEVEIPVVDGPPIIIEEEYEDCDTGPVWEFGTIPCERDLDFGDAPDGPYPTLKAWNGARHVIVPNILLGAKIDAEADGQPNATATGDDKNGDDDEDGVVFTSALIPGQWATVEVTANVAGHLDAWVDFSGGGSWAGDRIFNAKLLKPGINMLNFLVPVTATPNITTFARFRFSTVGGLGYTGLAPDGEVEDYSVDIIIGELDFGDAPEGAIAYPSTGVMGAFPTCITIGPATWIEHGLGWACFAGWDPELDGNAGLCPPPGCFPPYDQDECFQDGDAGLMFPEPYTIDAAGNVVPCPQCGGTALGAVCQTAVWGVDVDINVVNYMPCVGYVNVLMDWDQDGQWSGSSPCPGATAPEHVLVDFPVPIGYAGPLSSLGPPNFLVGPNGGYVWARFTITEWPVYIMEAFGIEPAQPMVAQPPPVGWLGWDGSGIFEDGETEDYLFRVDRQFVRKLDFGDAPDGPYPTLLANNGARHVIEPNICLGPNIDPEADGQPDATATGDDNDGNDDEDGVVFTSALIPGQLATVDVTAGAAGLLDAWVDFNADGSWAEPNDQIFVLQLLLPGLNSLSFWVPATATANINTFARFRFSTIGGLPFTGEAPDGEVEDYMVRIVPSIPTKPPVEHLKWSQPPIEWTPTSPGPVYCGWDEKAFTVALEPGAPARWYMVADDFRCLGSMPITSVHWWGSYEGWDSPTPPPVTPAAWLVGFWSNVPAGADPNFSYPRELLWLIRLPKDRVQEQQVGIDQFPQKSSDTCFQYFVQLDPNEYFWQDDFHNATKNNIFWISITAIYHDPILGEFFGWGWKTRPWHWMDDAVKFELEPDELKLDLVLDPNIIAPIEDAQVCGELESYDVAFELDTDPNYIKWEQGFIGIRRWSHYDDEESMAMVMEKNPIIRRQVADDWLCERRSPVTAAVWWGSYLGYGYEACRCQQMNPPVKPDYFLLSIWTDVPDPDPSDPGTFSHPGEKIWQYQAYDYDEVLVGYDKYPHEEPNEAVFRYSVRIPEPNQFCQEGVNNIYWFSVVAVYEGPNEPPYSWGWTNHKHTFNDDAVSGYPVTSGTKPVWRWQELHDQTGRSADMSFVLFTEPYEPLADGLVAYYPLEHNANDHSGNGHHGTVNGSPTYVTGPAGYGTAMHFDGTIRGNYVDLGTFNPSAATGQLSIALWAKWDGLTNEYQGLIAKRDRWSETGMMWQIEAYKDTGLFNFKSWRSRSDKVEISNPLPVGEWTHVGLTFDGTTAKFYINGELDASGPSSFGPKTDASVVFAAVEGTGARTPGAGPFNGALDEIHIYNRPLSQAEILYLAGP